VDDRCGRWSSSATYFDEHLRLRTTTSLGLLYDTVPRSYRLLSTINICIKMGLLTLPETLCLPTPVSIHHLSSWPARCIASDNVTPLTCRQYPNAKVLPQATPPGRRLNEKKCDQQAALVM
jgi:hypothetical protein